MPRVPHQRAKFLIRAKCNRRLAPGTAHDYVGEELQAARPLGRVTFALARQADRPARQVTLIVRARPVTFHGARRPGGDCRPCNSGPSMP
jgi:hypothetical protein